MHGPQGVLSFETDGDARWKFWIQPLKENNLGVAKLFVNSKRYQKHHLFFFISSRATLNETLTA